MPGSPMPNRVPTSPPPTSDPCVEHEMNDQEGHTDPSTLGATLREELKVGVRMMKALEMQLARAERAIQLESDATHRADETLERLQRENETLAELDRRSDERSHDQAKIMQRLEGLARDLGARLDAQAVRIAELDATMTTLERRIDLLTGESASSGTSSGSLSLPSPATESEDDRFRDELEHVRRVSASLAEAVEAAERTDATLRSTLATATSLDLKGPANDEAATTWSLTTMLRRLADEFDAAATLRSSPSRTVLDPSTTPPPTGITVDHPLEMDLTAAPAPSSTPLSGTDSTSGRV